MFNNLQETTMYLVLRTTTDEFRLIPRLGLKFLNLISVVRLKIEMDMYHVRITDPHVI